jgi:hypothetical protein
MCRPLIGLKLKPHGCRACPCRLARGTNLLLTEEAGFADCPPLVVYFKPDDETKKIVFLTVERLPEEWRVETCDAARTTDVRTATAPDSACRIVPWAGQVSNLRPWD